MILARLCIATTLVKREPCRGSRPTTWQASTQLVVVKVESPGLFPSRGPFVRFFTRFNLTVTDEREMGIGKLMSIYLLTEQICEILKEFCVALGDLFRPHLDSDSQEISNNEGFLEFEVSEGSNSR